MTNTFDLTGRHVLVTGGARGIGRMIAEGLLRRGVTVYVSTRKQDAADEAARELGELGEVHAFAVDVATEQGCQDLVENVLAYTGRLDGLINNAGATWGAPFDEFPDSVWDKIFGVNVKAPFNLARAARTLLEAAAADGAGPARIINIGSIDGLLVPNYENYSYAASKAAIHHLTRQLAANLAPSILVNAIAPGPFPTKMMKFALEEHSEEIERSNPLGRVGRPEDIDGTIAFLLSAASSYITGAVIPLDGGLTTTASVNLFDAKEA
ncbi:SDR family oxidoreductase [Tsukamurella tyrosinosolvens]|uniref:SDR family oxidoreductase n=1 Tax=Tsukamurella tyrosinosolvens TaxID=57704 RepID=UPI0007953D15|nr:SDR family oxidoreductase [Tsukamurella tyrosinosolvens]KXP04868.1 3-oxoacyl-ACP reductase [Tsukamurella tyrosinosolvens]